MNDANQTRIAVAAALDWEVRAILRALGRHAAKTPQRVDRRWTTTVAESRVVVYKTGVGLKKARRSTRAVIAEERPTLLVSSGCAGGLTADLRYGDLVAPRSIVGPPPSSATWATVPTAVAAASNASIVSVRGTLLAPSAKLALGAQCGAVAVDMESAAVAEAAGEAEIPLACLRVVLDPVATDLRPIEQLLARPTAKAAIAAGLRSPRAGLALIRLGWQTLAAARALEAAHDQLFASLLHPSAGCD